MEYSLQDIVLSHHSLHPDMELQDYMKLICQNEFGYGHMIKNAADSGKYLESEYREMLTGASRWEDSPSIEAIGNGLCRLYLHPDTIKADFLPLVNRLFVATANHHRGTMAGFQKKATLLYEMAVKAFLP